MRLTPCNCRLDFAHPMGDMWTIFVHSPCPQNSHVVVARLPFPFIARLVIVPADYPLLVAHCAYAPRLPIVVSAVGKRLPPLYFFEMLKEPPSKRVTLNKDFISCSNFPKEPLSLSLLLTVQKEPLSLMLQLNPVTCLTVFLICALLLMCLVLFVTRLLAVYS